MTDTNTAIAENIDTKDKAPKKTSHKILSVIGIILIVIFIPILICNALIVVKGLTSDSVPDIGGKMPMIVLTESMYPDIQGGDLIICDKCDPEEVEPGDIISFYDPASQSGTAIVTHRVVSITQTEDGELAWITKGDVNNIEDSKICPASKFVGIYNGVRFAGLGTFAMWIQSLPGLIICVILPIIILVGYDILRRYTYSKETDKEKDRLSKEIEELKAQQSEQNDIESNTSAQNR